MAFDGYTKDRDDAKTLLLLKMCLLPASVHFCKSRCLNVGVTGEACTHTISTTTHVRLCLKTHTCYKVTSVVHFFLFICFVFTWGLGFIEVCHSLQDKLKGWANPSLLLFTLCDVQKYVKSELHWQHNKDTKKGNGQHSLLFCKVLSHFL